MRPAFGVVQRIGAAGLVLAAVLALAAPFVATNATEHLFSDRAYAPPMRVHIRANGRFRAPFVYAQVLEDRGDRRFREDTTRPIPLEWLSRGHLVSIPDADGPLLLLGADELGRDILARLVYGARLSLAVALIGALGALGVGATIGGLAGSTGGRVDAWLMVVADFVIVLPGVYLVLVLRSILPLELSAVAVFWLMAGLFALAGWPHVARGVRAIVAAERSRDYAEAARAAGAGRWRLLRHLLPAARGFLGVEIVLLIPALLVAETTIAYLGLGFPEPSVSWGTMLGQAANVTVMREAPWMLAPAAALFIVVLSVQLVAGRRAEMTTLLTASQRAPTISSRP